VYTRQLGHGLHAAHLTLYKYIDMQPIDAKTTRHSQQAWKVLPALVAGRRVTALYVRLYSLLHYPYVVLAC